MAVHHGGRNTLPRKTEKLTIRIDPVIKDVLRESAEKEHRSVANLLEVLIRKHASRLGIRIKNEKTI